MSCSKTPKLIYFDGKGRAETARILLKQAGVDFEDKRIDFEGWPTLKKELDLPYGLPALEIDGKRYCQSLAIIQYIARKYGMYGDPAVPEQQLIIDIIGQCYEDVSTKLPLFEKDPEKKKDKLDELFEKVYPDLLGYVERHWLPSDGFIFGAKVCLADIGTMRMVEVLENMRPKSMDQYPKMKKLAATVAALPNIARWLKERPDTQF